MTAVDWNGTDAGPATYAEAVTPSDTNELTRVSRALYVGNTGDVAVVMSSGGTITFAAVPSGTLLPVRVRQVKTTGTTASGIVSVA